MIELLRLQHRAAGCLWTGGRTVESEKVLLTEQWLVALDLAVYHMPNADGWQTYRQQMTKTPVTGKYAKMVEWLEPFGYNPDRVPADSWARVPHADVIRVMNLCRALRGCWHEQPELRKLATLAKIEWDERKARAK